MFAPYIVLLRYIQLKNLDVLKVDLCRLTIGLDLATPGNDLISQPIAEAGVISGPVFLLPGSGQLPALHDNLIPFLCNLLRHLNIIPVNHFDLLSSWYCDKQS
jgi:hypothetical protein